MLLIIILIGVIIALIVNLCSKSMYICICKGVTDRQIRAAVLKGRVSKLSDIRGDLGACTQCGKCVQEAKQILHETLEERKLLNSTPIAPA